MLILGIAGGTVEVALWSSVAHEYHDTDVTVISQDSYYKDTSHLYL
jgi:uridine kinase